MPFPSKTTRTAAFAVAPFAGLLLFNINRYWPFLSDDALISLRYARRLLDGHGLTWTAGQPVEGYSNLLWVLMVAFVGLFGVDLVTAVRWLGVIGMIAVLFVLARECLRDDGTAWTRWLPVTLSLSFLALSAPMAVWAIGGLEQPLYAALIAGAIPLAYVVLEREGRAWPQVVGLSLLLGLLCLTRPDGPLFAATICGVLLGASWFSRSRTLARAAVWILLFPALFVGAQLAFRLAFYGEWVPNTALVKLPRSADRWVLGARYVTAGLRALAPLSYVAVAGMAALLLLRRTRARASCLAALAAVWTTYVAFIGGDIFPGYRHFVPLLVIFAFALAETWRVLMDRLSGRPAMTLVAAAAGLFLLLPFAQRQLTDPQSQRAIRERWEWDCRELALQLKSAFGRQQPLVAVTAAGCLPYWSELPAVDMLGLNDHYLPRHRPDDLADRFIGHDLGDGRYVLERNPDLIVFNVGSGPHYRSGEELAASAEFHERYVPVVLTTEFEGFPTILYVNKYSGSAGVGLTMTPHRITIPGFLLTGDRVRADLTRDGRPVAHLRGPASLAFRASEPVTGWQVEVHGPDPRPVSASVRQDGDSTVVTLEPEGAAALTVEVVVLRRPRDDD